MRLLFGIIAICGAGVFTGAMLTIGLTLGGFWKSLPPAEFLDWFSANESLIVRSIAVAAVPTVIGVIGTMLGVIAGLLLTLIVQPLVHLFELLFDVQFLKSDVYPLTYLPVEIAPDDITRVVVTALVMSFLATLYPAWRASRTRPADVLRYE